MEVYNDKNGKEIKADHIIEYNREDTVTRYRVFEKENGELDCIEVLDAGDTDEPIYNLRKEFWSKTEIIGR